MELSLFKSTALVLISVWYLELLGCFLVVLVESDESLLRHAVPVSVGEAVYLFVKYVLPRWSLGNEKVPSMDLQLSCAWMNCYSYMCIY